MQAPQAQAEGTAAALLPSEPASLAHTGPLATLLANSWLQNLPNIQQLLAELPPPSIPLSRCSLPPAVCTAATHCPLTLCRGAP